MRAFGAGSPEAEAFLAMTTSAIHDMAVKAEEDQQPLARSVAEMMRRLGRGSYSTGLEASARHSRTPISCASRLTETR